MPPWRPDKYDVDYAVVGGADSFTEQLDAFGPKIAQHIGANIRRLRDPNYHDLQTKKGGIKKLKGRAAQKVKLHELRIDTGPGYRVYFGYRGTMLIMAGTYRKRPVQS